jgi:hypothetical protein
MTLPTSQVLAAMVQAQYRTERPFRVSIDLLKDLKQMGNLKFGISGTINKTITKNMKKNIDIGPYNRGELCPYCNSPTLEVTGDEIYGPGRGYGHIKMFKCSGSCDAYSTSKWEHGLRVSTGSLANKELRELRKKCHQLFDVQWKGKTNEKLARRKCYAWLQEFTKLPEELAHFGMFNVEQCRQIIEELTKSNNSER